MPWAAEAGDIEAMKTLLGAGIDINIRDSKGLTPLTYSIFGGKLESVRFLLERGARIDNDNFYELSPLDLVAGIGALEILTLLLDYGGDVDLQGYNGATALHHAIMMNQPEAVKLLISRDANVNLAADDCSCLHVAVQRTETEIASMLLEAGAQIDVFNIAHETPLHIAVASNNTEMVNLLLANYSGDQFDEPLAIWDDPPLLKNTAMTIDIDKDDDVIKIIGHPDSKRWCCAVNVRNPQKNDDHKLFRPYHAGAVLLCVSDAPDEKLFLKLVRRFLCRKHITNFEILECYESPVGSLRKDVEDAFLELEELAVKQFQETGETNRIIYLYVPAILRYGRTGSKWNVRIVAH